jgi:hypothetical protein
MAMLTAERLREVLAYDPETGVFTRRVSRGPMSAGSTAGYPDRDGYLMVCIDYQAYFAHRLAWLYTFGEWPSEDIDHIDRNPSNNALANLRPASRSENLANTKARRDNTSGKKGVWWHKSAKKWAAGITVKRRAHHLGLFESIEDAAAAYEHAAKKHFGEFARVA